MRRFVELLPAPSRKPGVIYLVCPRCDAEFLAKLELFRQQPLRRRSVSQARRSGAFAERE
jgi:hypothetical protein